MLVLYFWFALLAGDPITVVQLRYPAYRTTITTTSGYTVVYSLATNAPAELRRAYKVLELAERDVLITDALQQFRLEIVQNERRLESLRTARMVAYLSGTFPGPSFYCFDPSGVPAESQLRAGLSYGLAADATVERAVFALDRLADARAQVYQALIGLAYPNRERPNAARRAEPAPAVVPVKAAPDGAAPVAVEKAEKAEQAAAEAEALAEKRERDARVKELAAEARYRDSLPADRAAARAAWLTAREEWEAARRDWDAARDEWRLARDRLAAARANRAPPRPVAGLPPTIEPFRAPPFQPAKQFVLPRQP
jgi:hypothetical protein